MGVQTCCLMVSESEKEEVEGKGKGGKRKIEAIRAPGRNGIGTGSRLVLCQKSRKQWVVWC